MSEEAKTKKAVPAFLKYLLGTILLVVVSAGAAVLVVRQNPQVLGLSKGQAQVQAEVDSLVSEVGKLMALPADEKPTVATVTDADKLKEQPFFANAQTGDKVLIYTSTKRAILYRPSEKRIIDVGAVNIRQQEAATETTPATTPEATEKPTKAPKVETKE